MNKSKFWKDRTFYTDYPLIHATLSEVTILDMEEILNGPENSIYEIKVLSYDGNKYCRVYNEKYGECEIKIGYVHLNRELTHHVPWGMAQLMQGLKLKHLRRRVSKTTYTIFGERSYDLDTVSATRRKLMLLKEGVTVVKQFSGISRWSSTPIADYGPMVDQIMYKPATSKHKPGPRIRVFDRPPKC